MKGDTMITKRGLMGASLALGALSALVSACSESTPRSPSIGSETHWLQACAVQADCPAAADCVCNLCTIPCDPAAADSCGAAGAAASCVASDSPALSEACPSAAPAAAICVATCAADADCDATTACVDGVCIAREAILPESALQLVVVPDRPTLDVLFVVDNSGSMCEEQSLLARALSEAAQRLADVDLRVAAVSTDLRNDGARGQFIVTPAEPVPAVSCFNPGTEEPSVPDTADCAQALAGVDFEGGVLRSPGGLSPERIAAAARCLTTLGTTGDSFEKGLEAMRLALACDGPQAALYAPCCVNGRFDPQCGAALPFLRPEAGLLVVVLSDEPDCSDPASNPAQAQRALCRGGVVDADADGVPDVYATPVAGCSGDPAACFQAECDGAAAPDCHARFCEVSRSSNDSCVLQREALTPVDDYVRFLSGLKPQGGLGVQVLPIVGRTLRDPAGAALSYSAREPSAACLDARSSGDADATVAACCAAGECDGGLIVSCTSGSGVAFSGERYVALSERFCDPSEAGCGEQNVSVCSDAYDVGGAVAQALGRLEHLFCLVRAPQGDERVEVQRNGAVIGADRFSVVEHRACESGVAVDIAAPAPGATYLVRIGR